MVTDTENNNENLTDELTSLADAAGIIETIPEEATVVSARV